ncbi:MAG: hypothetical protein FWC61_03355 [Proteobacteria bacterium]|nr:hypothetical protein [Pseudomonadota bacterium]
MKHKNNIAGNQAPSRKQGERNWSNPFGKFKNIIRNGVALTAFVVAFVAMPALFTACDPTDEPQPKPPVTIDTLKVYRDITDISTLASLLPDMRSNLISGKSVEAYFVANARLGSDFGTLNALLEIMADQKFRVDFKNAAIIPNKDNIVLTESELSILQNLWDAGLRFAANMEQGFRFYITPALEGKLTPEQRLLVFYTDAMELVLENVKDAPKVIATAREAAASGRRARIVIKGTLNFNPSELAPFSGLHKNPNIAVAVSMGAKIRVHASEHPTDGGMLHALWGLGLTADLVIPSNPSAAGGYNGIIAEDSLFIMMSTLDVPKSKYVYKTIDQTGNEINPVVCSWRSSARLPGPIGWITMDGSTAKPTKLDTLHFDYENGNGFMILLAYNMVRDHARKQGDPDATAGTPILEVPAQLPMVFSQSSEYKYALSYTDPVKPGDPYKFFGTAVFGFMENLGPLIDRFGPNVNQMTLIVSSPINVIYTDDMYKGLYFNTAIYKYGDINAKVLEQLNLGSIRMGKDIQIWPFPQNVVAKGAYLDFYKYVK